MAKSNFSFGLWFLSVVALSIVTAYPSGAPSEACDGMNPTGHSTDAQTSASEYEINLSSATYCPKKDVTITLMGKNNVMIKGFLCQPRTVVNTYETPGTLTSSDTDTTNKCTGTGKQSLTHTKPLAKSSVVLKWTANEGLNTTVFIVCTVVKEKSVFWVKQNVQLTYAGAGNCDKGIGDSCSSNDNCKSDSMAVCMNQTCACPVTYKESTSQSNKVCVPKVLNDQCATNAECADLTNAKCTDGMCKLDEMGVCTSDTDCSGMDEKKCMDGKCTSGAVRTILVSFVLILGCLFFTLL